MRSRCCAASPARRSAKAQLRCYYAGKPYIYDPYNATRMVHLGQLDPQVLVTALRSQQYGAVQLGGPIDDGGRMGFFAPVILAAIREYYRAGPPEPGRSYLPAQFPPGRAGRQGAYGPRVCENCPQELEKCWRTLKTGSTAARRRAAAILVPP